MSQAESRELPTTSVSSCSTFSYAIVKRDGRLVPFQRARILRALEAAFRDTKQIPQPKPLADVVHQIIELLTTQVEQNVLDRLSQGERVTVEDVQDLVERFLMEQGHHDVVRDYIIYRDKHKTLREDSPRNIKILRKDGSSFMRLNPMKIGSAIAQSFHRSLDMDGLSTEQLFQSVHDLTHLIVNTMVQRAKRGEALSVDDVEDEIERQLMKAGFYATAKRYILNRLAHPEEQESTFHDVREENLDESPIQVKRADGSQYQLSNSTLRKRIEHACKGYEATVDANLLVHETLSNFYEGIQEHEVDLAMMLAARSKIEQETSYTYVASNLLLDRLYRETLHVEAYHPKLQEKHATYFQECCKQGVILKKLDPAILSFDLKRLAGALDLNRDHIFTYLGLQTLYDRYFLHEEGHRLETPQIFWMRVAMGLALNEKEKDYWAIEFYNILSQFRYLPGTPTLFNSGTPHSQLSSCYLSTVMDDLHHIYKVISDDAQLSKWAGGLGNDWTNIRATGASIKGTNGQSQGVIPFLKVANDTAVAVNQGGKRKGALCVYLESWHLDVEDFLELRKNTGDERRRTHDMNTANWIPDLFMKRVLENGRWTLFSPNEVPDLHHIYGRAFEERYIAYEQAAIAGKIKQFKTVDALQLWRKMLGMIFETGHPWITFKDPSNIRSPQDHAGVIHSSNLCTEILLNTSNEEVAVCNIGSINVAVHTQSDGIQEDLLAETVRIAMRMLDNVVDVNFYPIPEARASNLRHRPVGLGMMGFVDALYIQNISYASQQAIEFSDYSMELISYHAILASCELAKERGPYSSFKGSKWDRGLLPIDTLDMIAAERGDDLLDVDRSCKLDWSPIRAAIRKYGMRNSNTLAIAPTATISNIAGVTQSIEPMYKHLFVKSNLSGEFTILNPFLVKKLKELDLWNADLVDDLKYFDGSLSEIETIPQEIKDLFPTAFEMDPIWLIECASRRQKWIDMGQSLNLYLAEPSGKKLHDMYFMAWKKGLKTTYYLRTLGATQIEKSTTDINKRDLQPRWMKNKSATSRVQVQRTTCSLGEGCESCQ